MLLSCLRTLIYLFLTTFKLLDFLIFRLWAYLMKIVPRNASCVPIQIFMILLESGKQSPIASSPTNIIRLNYPLNVNYDLSIYIGYEPINLFPFNVDHEHLFLYICCSDFLDFSLKRIWSYQRNGFNISMKCDGVSVNHQRTDMTSTDDGNR